MTNPHPELIQQFCTQAIENGTLKAAMDQARKDLFRDWCDEPDKQRQDTIHSTMKALEKVQGIMEGFSMHAPEVD